MHLLLEDFKAVLVVADDNVVFADDGVFDAEETRDRFIGRRVVDDNDKEEKGNADELGIITIAVNLVVDLAASTRTRARTRTRSGTPIILALGIVISYFTT